MSKRLSALAQLVAIYQNNGITTAAALSAKTGYSERQIWRARGELTDIHDTDADVRDPDARVTDNPDARVRVEDDPSRARIESTLRVDTSIQKVEVDSVANAPAEAPQGSKYAFEGRVIKLLPRDFQRWQGAFRNIPDLTAALEVADAYYHEKPIPDGKWFFKVSRWLATENLKPKEAQTGRGGVIRWQDQPSPGRAAIARALAACRGEVVQ